MYLRLGKLLTIMGLSSLLALSSARAQLTLDVTSLTSNTITFTIGGSLTGSGLTFNFETLWLEPLPGTVLFSGGTDGAYSSTFSSSPIQGKTVMSVDAVKGNPSGFGDYFAIALSGPLVVGDLGTGTPVTIDFSGTPLTFDLTTVTDLGLYWGYTSESSQPFGVFQSMAAVPEPREVAFMTAIFLVGLIGVRRAHKRRRASVRA